MKTESDESLKTLKKEFNEKMKGRRKEEDKTHSRRSEDLEETESDVDLNDSPERQQETVRSSTKKLQRQRQPLSQRLILLMNKRMDLKPLQIWPLDDLCPETRM